MSRRAAVVEEFDDDTDLPLPSKPLPNTGARGAILEELDMTDSEGDDDDDTPNLLQPTAGPASPSLPQFRPGTGAGGDAHGTKTVTDITPYKKWTCIYPIYIDAKRPCGRGERRIARAKSVWWPLSKDIADATNRLGLGTLHEVSKAHPRDWENPGRVRVQWRKDGRLVNPAIKTKKQLLEMISIQIQLLKPDGVPKPPYDADQPAPAAAEAAAPPMPVKGKQPAKGGSKATSVSNTTISPPETKQRAQKVPAPPQPWPALTSRVSPYSPALPSGVLIETVKAGMSAQEANPPVGGGGGKGKRKVVRVRG